MEAADILSLAYGALITVMGFLLKRIFSLLDELRKEDMVLHEKINEVRVEYLTKGEFESAVSRILARFDKLEEIRLIK